MTSYAALPNLMSVSRSRRLLRGMASSPDAEFLVSVQLGKPTTDFQFPRGTLNPRNVN